ncbi:uncharacterized protein PV06_01059 [Exophiala oligosperma]|uniref:Heterokaryon incompatibility domain-containing protein n=1 Tax=Exophiala oligosperma TaxID=215243 RepID=A0A0D2EKR8_9EURO|nr:uncharacterized protein PV06_01059 [Exophiala oligosperma]KIW48479.1 hypothetical protein PV06_01059 [Exophiala oligosperma]
MTTSDLDTSITNTPRLAGLAPRVVQITADEWDSFRKRDTRLLPRKNESFIGYVSRVKGWKYFNDSSRFEDSAAWAAERASRTYFWAQDIWDGFRYRIKFRGACSCTDLVAMRKLHTFWPTLRDFQRTASAGCGRCWFIVRSVALFESRYADIDPGQIQVHIKDTGHFYQGDYSRIRVRWLPDGSGPTLEPYLAQLSQEYRTIDLVLYADEGYKMDRGFFRRTLPPTRSDDGVCIDKIKHWIDECIRDHGCGLDIAQRGLPTRLVDVSPDDRTEGLRLAIGSEILAEDTPFAALSHCWGDKKDRIKAVPKTTMATLSRHLEKIEWDDLTPTFRDTINHSLCIVQDDGADFAREAARMALIYSQAHVVIAATRGNTGDAGLFHSRRGAQELIIHEDNPRKSSYLHVKETIPHDAFLTNDPYRFNTTPLFERAWCFQERLLGRRVVHFSADEIVFECGNNLDCECMEIRRHRRAGTFKTTTLKTLSNVKGPTSRIELWYSVVEPYSACALHDEADRLPALSGFSRLIASKELDGYCAGLWRYEFPSGLLWRAVRAAPGETQTQRPKEYCGPSWSWIAVRARIEAHISWHFANEIVAEVVDVQTCPKEIGVPFGAVTSAFLILAGPAVSVTLHQEETSGHQESRECFMSLAQSSGTNHTAALEDEDPDCAPGAEPESRGPSWQPFQLDVPAEVNGLQAVCIAIERWHPRINSGQGTCLLLQAVPGEASYTRLGVSFCPASWFQVAHRMEVKIV